MNIRNDRGIIKWLLIGLCAIFLIVALVLPLVYVIVTALRDGWNEYVTAISDTYAVKSILLTLKVVVITVVVNTIFGLYAAWLITKFTFRGKKIISTLIDLPLTISRSSRALYSYLHLAGRASCIHTLKSSGYRYSHRSHSPTYAGLCCTELYCAPQGPWVNLELCQFSRDISEDSPTPCHSISNCCTRHLTSQEPLPCRPYWSSWQSSY